MVWIRGNGCATEKGASFYMYNANLNPYARGGEKSMLSMAGFSRDTEVYNILDGIRSRKNITGLY